MSTKLNIISVIQLFLVLAMKITRHTYLIRLEPVVVFRGAETVLTGPEAWLLEADSDLLAWCLQVTSKGNAPKVPGSSLLSKVPDTSLLSCRSMKPLPWKLSLRTWEDGECIGTFKGSLGDWEDGDGIGIFIGDGIPWSFALGAYICSGGSCLNSSKGIISTGISGRAWWWNFW